jgi:5-methylcytosine-specific restriction endonuclease McrA
VQGYSVPVPTPEQVAAQRSEPVDIWRAFLAAQLSAPASAYVGSIWLYHNYWAELEDSHTYSEDEVPLLIKRPVLREERELARVRQEVETLERVSDMLLVSREMIPDDVRLFVWQRDKGQCVRCSSREKWEFDHIIPVADGGSSTERNVQLLCEPCNRSKGRSV